MPRGRPSRKQVFERFDRALDDLEAVGGLPLPVEAEGIWKDIWHEETHHSTAIEGNTLVLRQVKTLLDEGRAVGNKELREYLEIEGYADAARWVYSQAVRGRVGADGSRALIDKTELREIHRLTTAPAWDRFPPEPMERGEGSGSFRLATLQPLRAGLAAPMPISVPGMLDDWIDQVNAGPADDVHFCGWLAARHAHFERIHPFRDGNGRVGRLVLNLLLVRHGAPPAIIYKRDRGIYLKALQKADQRDCGPLGELIARSVRHSVERHVLPALAGTLRLVPLGALETPGLSRLALLSAAKRGRLRVVKLSDAYYSTRSWVDDYDVSRQRGKRAA